MKTKAVVWLLVVGLLFSLCGCSDKKSAQDILGVLCDKQKVYGTVFGDGKVVDINVEIAQEDWQDICENPTAEAYHPATITVNGTTLENVGFRTKGFSSLTTVAKSDSNRYGFKVKTDEYVHGQTLNGLDMFVLNGHFADPSYMREYFTYAAMAHLEGITPFVTYTNLSINGELFGFYLCVEAYDDSFVQRHATAADTVLYKAESENCTLLPSDDGSGFTLSYGKDDGCTHIQQLISVLNATTADNKAELERLLDVDSVLKSLAVNTVMGNYDSYSGSKAHNYYLLYTNGKFSYIGWDYNMSIGGFNEDNGASVTVDVRSPVYNVEISKRPLIEKLLAIDTYKDTYLQYVNALLTYFADFEGMVSTISGLIDPHVENDPTAFYTVEQYRENLTASGKDLSQMTGNQPGGQRPNMPEGGQKPNMPEGGQMPNMPEGGQMPNMPEGGQMPSMPEGGQMPNMPEGGQMPSMPEGMDRPGGDGMMNHEAVSIVDYMTQRIAYIQKQLGNL